MPIRFPHRSNRGQRPADGKASDPNVCASVMTAQEFGAHFRTCTRVMWLIAVGIVGDAAEAEDVVQEAALIAFRKRNAFEQGTSFRAWVGAIVRNVAMNTQRSGRRRRELVEEWAVAGPMSQTPMAKHASNGAVVSTSMVDSRVIRALSDIGDVARACLLLRTVGELHYAEIATLLAIPEGTAMSHVHRTRARLRERLAGVWNEHSGGVVDDLT